MDLSRQMDDNVRKNCMEDQNDPKRPIDRLRDGAGRMDIRTPDDDSPVAEVISTGKRLLVVKGRGLYEIKLADQVDPLRTNINTPNTFQQILPYGADSAWVATTVLTADRLFHNAHCPKQIDGQIAFDLVLELAADIAGAHRIREDFEAAEKSATETLEMSIPKDRSFRVPSIRDVKARCTEFLQRLDYALQKLFQLVKMFYPNLGKGGWNSLRELIENGPKGLDNFPSFLGQAVPFLLLVRNARNCAEHPTSAQHVLVTDFTIDAGNTLLPPMIQIIHPRTPLPNAVFRDFLTQSVEGVATTVEMMMAFLCSRHVEPFGDFDVQVVEMPKERRRSPHVRFGYGVLMGDQIVPIG